MTIMAARQALLPGGWAENVRIHVENGLVQRVETGVETGAGPWHDVILPGMPNLHSHAFQHAMAGLAETRGPGADSFWSWRTLMYRFALSMSPDDAEAVAAKLYADMLEAGFTRIGEFHYLHHAPDGSPYADRAEMAVRIAAAAGRTGIALTLLPVFYAHSGFGGQAPVEGQRRFINDLDGYQRLHEGCAAALKGLDHAVLGIAPHSLRAATAAELDALLAIHKTGPVHIHIAEQVKEVEDCVAFTGQRPVEWLLANQPVDHRWCLIHATHMTDAETRAMAASGAVAGLCPVTEANLGDGIFPAPAFREAGGQYGVGSDSNVLIGIGDELRQLEYSQRLGLRSRNVIAPPGVSTGRTLYDEALAGGARALGAAAGIATGNPADFLSLDLSAAPWLTGDAVLDSLIFAGNLRPDTVWVAGREQVRGGRHLEREAIDDRFRATMTALAASRG